MMITRYAHSYSGMLLMMLMVLTVHACAGPAGNPAGAPLTGTTDQAPGVTAMTLTPAPTPTAPATMDFGPGFVTTPTPLPEGFPTLPEAHFVAYNPAFDPCASGNVLCPVRQFPPQVWLYEMMLPEEDTTRTVANEYAVLLEAAGYHTAIALADDATNLDVTGPEGVVRHASILIGPSVRLNPAPAEARLIGIRITVEQQLQSSPTDATP